MASNSTQLGCANTSYKYTLSVSWSESETNIANNTTKISANGSLSASNVGFDAMYDSYACHLKLYWHDNNNNTDTLFATSGAFTTCGMGYGTRSVSGSITVTHKSDGSLSGYVKVYFEAPTTSGGWSPSSSSCSTGWTTCTTIARASSISGLSGNQLNSGVSVTIDRKSSSFTHKVEYKFVNSGWTTVSSNAATSCSFTPPLSLASQIPSAVSGALTVRVTTYNGSTQIGSSVTKSINLSVPSNVVPSLSGLSATRIDNDVPSSWGIYVKGISQVKITASGASGSYGSTISGYSISGPGLYTNSSSGTSGQLTSTGTQTYTCTVTDSRGRTASKSVSITVVDYSYPSISMSVERCKSDGTKDTSGTYLRVVINYGIASVSDKNSIASKSCSCNGVSNSSFASGTAFVLAANCSIGTHYFVDASIRDALGRTASASAEVSTAYRVLNINKNKDGVAIGKFSEKSAFEVNMDTYLYNDLQVKGDVNSGGSITSGGNASIGKDIYQSPSSCSESNLGSVPIAGTINSMTLGDIRKYKSGLYTSVVDGDWSYLWVNKHRNGADDGNSYNNYIMQSFWDDNMYHGRVNSSGEVQSKYQFIDARHWNDMMAGNTNVVVKSALLNLIYPIGSVYFSRVLGSVVNATCPIKSVLGGTWQLVEVSIHSMNHSNFAIDVSGGKFQNSQNIQLYQSNGGQAQRWVHGLWNLGSYNTNASGSSPIYDPPKSPGGQGWLCIWVRTA